MHSTTVVDTKIEGDVLTFQSYCQQCNNQEDNIMMKMTVNMMSYLQFQNLANLSEGDIAHFEASLTPVGDQSMVVEWFYNGEVLKASKLKECFPVLRRSRAGYITTRKCIMNIKVVQNRWRKQIETILDCCSTDTQH